MDESPPNVPCNAIDAFNKKIQFVQKEIKKNAFNKKIACMLQGLCGVGHWMLEEKVCKIDEVIRCYKIQVHTLV